MTNSDLVPDFATLYPADFESWRDRPSVTLSQAVFLSLGIDPDAVDEATALDASSCDGFNVGTDLSHSPYYGQQHGAYWKRMDAIGHACRHGTLACEQRGNVDCTRLSAFVAWARDRQWEVPAGLVALAELQVEADPARTATRARRRGPRDETKERRTQIKEMAETELRRRPTLSKAELARAVNYQLEQSGSAWKPAADTVRNMLFYDRDPLFTKDGWTAAKAHARTVRQATD